MSTWSWVHAVRVEHVDHLARAGVLVPTVSPGNRAPDQADVEAAYAEIGSPLDLLIDTYRTDDAGELTVAVRGNLDRALALFLALAKRCGQLYVFPFPYDAAPGIVVVASDDLVSVLRRMDPATRASMVAELQL